MSFAVQELKGFFYIDADVIFRELPDFSLLKKGNYASNTVSYLGAAYLLHNDEQLFFDMCSVVGIFPEVVQANENNSGGAHYLIRDTTLHFWDKVYREALNIYDRMLIAEGRYVKQHSQDFPAQSWCAEMWATLWNL